MEGGEGGLECAHFFQEITTLTWDLLACSHNFLLFLLGHCYFQGITTLEAFQLSEVYGIMVEKYLLHYKNSITTQK